MRLLFLAMASLCLASPVWATNLYFSDLADTSPSGSYRVEAKSPDNQKGREKAFQANFVYVCTETASGEVLWTRRQPMQEPWRFVADESGIREANANDKPEAVGVLQLCLEPSPIDLLVSDSGWTVIRTYHDDLVVVAPNGDTVGTVSVLKDAFNEEDDKHVQHSFHGSYWSGNSTWYFLTTAEGEFLVIRPWWGRRVFLSVHAGAIAGCDRDVLSIAAAAEEREIVLRTLRTPVDLEDPGWSYITAAYLAGVLSIPEAVPLLRVAEKSTYCSSVSLGRFEEFQNDVDPLQYREFRLRQIAQLSLRRLGEKPASLPCYRFGLLIGKRAIPFSPMPIEPQRHENVAEVKIGMGAKDVLLKLGSPDVVGVGRTDTWNYDMDAPEPFSVAITFSGGRVAKVERLAAEWKGGLTRDEQVSD